MEKTTHGSRRRTDLGKRFQQSIQSIERAVGKVISVKVGVERADGRGHRRPYHVRLDLTLPRLGLQAGLQADEEDGRRKLAAAITRALTTARTEAREYLSPRPARKPRHAAAKKSRRIELSPN